MPDELVRISPSQFKLARLCWRKWAFAYVLGMREGPSRATELGKRVHTILEAYIKAGTVPDPNETWSWEGSRAFYPGRIALTMMQEGFPAPGEGKVEGSFEFVHKGVIWNGKIDWHIFEQLGGVTFMDHKTSSDPKKWGLAQDTLGTDVQAIVYARALLEEYSTADAPVKQVRALWNYGSTDAVASKARVVRHTFAPGEVYARFENEIVPMGQEIRRLKLLKADPLSLEPNPDACFAYHKQCPHAKACNLTTKDRIGALLMGNALLDSLLSEAGTQPAATPAAPVTPPPAPADAVNPPEASAPAAPTPPVAAPTVPVAPTPPVAPAAAPTPPVAPAAAPTAPAAPSAPAAAAKRSPGRPRKAAAPAGALTESVAGIAANLAELRKVDPDLASRVADHLAQAIAEKLLGE